MCIAVVSVIFTIVELLDYPIAFSERGFENWLSIITKRSSLYVAFVGMLTIYLSLDKLVFSKSSHQERVLLEMWLPNFNEILKEVKEHNGFLCQHWIMTQLPMYQYFKKINFKWKNRQQIKLFLYKFLSEDVLKAVELTDPHARYFMDDGLIKYPKKRFAYSMEFYFFTLIKIVPPSYEYKNQIIKDFNELYLDIAENLDFKEKDVDSLAFFAKKKFLVEQGALLYNHFDSNDI